MSLEWTLETVFQMAALAAIAALVPVGLSRLHRPSLGLLSLDLLAGALVAFLAATVLFAALYTDGGAPLSAALLPRLFMLGLSSSIIWLPVLLLTGLGLAQWTEARRSKEREAREAARR